MLSLIHILRGGDPKLRSSATRYSRLFPAHAGVIPVSYTHLDVYKRQVYGWEREAPGGAQGEKMRCVYEQTQEKKKARAEVYLVPQPEKMCIRDRLYPLYLLCARLSLPSMMSFAAASRSG